MTSSLRYYPGPSGVKAIVDWLSVSQMMRHPVFRFHLQSELVQSSSSPRITATRLMVEDVARSGRDQAVFDAGSASSVPGQEFIEPGRRAIG
jgi:hypothetical protein